MLRCTLSLLFSSVNRHCSLSLSSYVVCSSPVTILAELTPMCQCLCCPEDSTTGHRTPYAVSELSNGERINSLGLLTTLLVKQLRIQLAAFAARTHCFMFNLMSTRPPRSISSKLLLIQLSPSLYCWMELFHPRYKILHLLLMNFLWKCWPHVFFKFSMDTHIETQFP